jgi:hypothetical protein
MIARTPARSFYFGGFLLRSRGPRPAGFNQIDAARVTGGEHAVNTKPLFSLGVTVSPCHRTLTRKKKGSCHRIMFSRAREAGDTVTR